MIPSSALRYLGVLLLMAAWMVAAYMGGAGRGNADINTLVAITPAAVAGVMALWRLPGLPVRAVGALALMALLAWSWPQLRSNVPLLYYLQHLGIHVALGVLFGKSLLGPGDALITRMARRIFAHELSARKVRYTRNLTLIWTLFFFVNALVSTVLFVWAPPAVWSIHAKLLTGPLVALMFLVELVWRRVVLPPHERPRLTDIVKAYRRESTHRAARSTPP